MCVLSLRVLCVCLCLVCDFVLCWCLYLCLSVFWVNCVCMYEMFETVNKGARLTSMGEWGYIDRWNQIKSLGLWRYGFPTTFYPWMPIMFNNNQTAINLTLAKNQCIYFTPIKMNNGEWSFYVANIKICEENFKFNCFICQANHTFNLTDQSTVQGNEKQFFFGCLFFSNVYLFIYFFLWFENK